MLKGLRRTNPPESRTLERCEAVIELRPVEATDDAFLRDVYASTRATEMAMVPWSDEEKAAFLDMQLPEGYGE